MEGFNINGCVVQEFHTKSFHDIADASVTALEGIGPVAQGIFEDSVSSRNTVKTVRELGSWRYYRLARALVDLRDAELKGKREEHSETSLRAALVKTWASKSLEEICGGPLSAFNGLSAAADKSFAKAPLHITSVEKLAECKFCKWASAICTLADLAEEEAQVVKIHRQLELAESAKQAALDAQAVAEKMAEAAKAALAEALQRVEAAEKAKAGAEAKEKAEHEREEAAEKQKEAATAKAKIAEKALEDAIQKLTAAEEEKATAEKQRKEEAQKRRAAERRAKLAEQEKAGKELEARFRSLFKEMDGNGNGYLSHTELKNYVASKDMAARLKLGIGRWQDFLTQVDADHDGRISEEEFVSHFTRTNLDAVKCYGALFDAIDFYGNGYITNGEFTDYQRYMNPNLLRLLGVRDWQDFVASVDLAGDGVIHRDEFLAHYTNKHHSGEVLSIGEDAGEPAAKRARN